MDGCPFCNKEILSKQKVYETENEYVLYNYRKTKCIGRGVVIPKKHVTMLHDLSNDEAKSLFGTVWYVAGKIRDHYKPLGINYGFNEGEIAGQTIFHLHFHILPRYENDEMPEFHLFHGDPKKKSVFKEDELNKLTLELREVLR